MVNLPLGWIQLKKQPLRLAVALCGVAFAVVLVLMQLGFRDSMFDSAVRYHEKLNYDIVLLSPKSPFIVQLRPFPRQRLYQTVAVDGVESVAPVSIYLGIWKRPASQDRRFIFVVAFDPSHEVLDAPGVETYQKTLTRPDTLIYDSLSRLEYGDIASRFRDEGELEVELNERKMRVSGLFTLGTSFGIDGSVLMSDVTFRRVFPERDPGEIDLGLIQLQPGADPVRVASMLRQQLPEDVLALTRQEFIERERGYWAATTPIGYVLGFGLVVGLLVGAIIVYQILFADVTDHMDEYATLKAMGYSNLFLSWVVLQQALVLATLGFFPGLLAALFLYQRASVATSLPLEMAAGKAVLVFLLTIIMCSVSGLFALRKVWTTDPARIF